MQTRTPRTYLEAAGFTMYIDIQGSEHPKETRVAELLDRVLPSSTREHFGTVNWGGDESEERSAARQGVRSNSNKINRRHLESLKAG